MIHTDRPNSNWSNVQLTYISFTTKHKFDLGIMQIVIRLISRHWSKKYSLVYVVLTYLCISNSSENYIVRTNVQIEYYTRYITLSIINDYNSDLKCT